MFGTLEKRESDKNDHRTLACNHHYSAYGDGGAVKPRHEKSIKSHRARHAGNDDKVWDNDSRHYRNKYGKNIIKNCDGQ